MAVETGRGDAIRENSVLTTLLEAGGPELKRYRGYVGRSEKAECIRLYPRLADLGTSFEIRGADIVHVEQIPEAFAPFGASLVWVKPDADVASRVEAVATRKAAAADANAVEVRRGRIRMVRQGVARDVVAAGPGENCASYCQDCSSQCEVCMSGCTCY